VGLWGGECFVRVGKGGAAGRKTIGGTQLAVRERPWTVK